MVKIKHDVDLRPLQAPMAVALTVAASVWADRASGTDLVVTSGAEGQHMVGSLHYKGLALDLRLPPAQSTSVVIALLKDALGPQFDVVVEVDHVHIEFDPKKTTL